MYGFDVSQRHLFVSGIQDYCESLRPRFNLKYLGLRRLSGTFLGSRQLSSASDIFTEDTFSLIVCEAQASAEIDFHDHSLRTIGHHPLYRGIMWTARGESAEVDLGIRFPSQFLPSVVKELIGAPALSALPTLLKVYVIPDERTVQVNMDLAQARSSWIDGLVST